MFDPMLWSVIGIFAAIFVVFLLVAALLPRDGRRGSDNTGGSVFYNDDGDGAGHE